MRLYLVRHGQTAWNIAGRAQGHTDIPLDAVGEAQAEHVGRRFADAGIAEVWSSDLVRCRQTAAPIVRATGAVLTVDRNLRERSFGEWEGTSFDMVSQNLETEAHQSGINLARVRPPGGESYADVWERVAPLTARLRTVDQSTVVVSHGGTTCVLLAQLVNGTVETSRSFKFGNTSVTTLEPRADGNWLIVEYADLSHWTTSPLLPPAPTARELLDRTR